MPGSRLQIICRSCQYDRLQFDLLEHEESNNIDMITNNEPEIMMASYGRGIWEKMNDELKWRHNY